ncbi:unnamed protein product [Plutella xylostella]|uniref:(diamondback moth) hypothetical protein n=1 Tax=Plutella xylostella TaxID=51655 RepID=A0A8S4D898_PLUXY|nr:unnamed protein product [Plutella xylostella]
MTAKLLKWGCLSVVERRSQASSAACLRRPAPPTLPAAPAPRAAPPAAPAPPAPAPAPPPLRPLDNTPTPTKKHRLKTTKPKQDDGECEVADDAGSLDEKDFSRTQNKTIHSNSESTIVRGKEELPCYRELHVYNAMRKTFEDTNGNEADDEGGEERGPGAGGEGAGVSRRARLPPRRTTPDGTDIYYWCDVPKRKWSELDDGAYNPLWAMRGFTQTFHLWKEGRRAQCTPLHASLTYVTLPWWSIAKDILDIREEPILTF